MANDSVMEIVRPLPPKALNSQAPWDSFDSSAYFTKNYRTLLKEDRQILGAVRDHFGAHFERHPASGLRGLDVGAGTNLYPSLAMLPWCAEITLFERAHSNVAWLRSQLPGYAATWDEFWELLGEHPAYRAVGDPRARLAQVARVVQGDLFTELPEQPADIGTMFFVAESLSSACSEFVSAVDKFAGALAPGAPFAVAFMENSDGYTIAGVDFPAYEVETEQVLDSLHTYAQDDLGVRRIEVPEKERARAGYTGMLVALGRMKRS